MVAWISEEDKDLERRGGQMLYDVIKVVFIPFHQSSSHPQPPHARHHSTHWEFT